MTVKSQELTAKPGFPTDTVYQRGWVNFYYYIMAQQVHKMTTYFSVMTIYLQHQKNQIVIYLDIQLKFLTTNKQLDSF